MKITPDMTTDGGRKLIDLADYQDGDGTGIKAQLSQWKDQVKIRTDSYSRALAYLRDNPAADMAVGQLWWAEQ